MEGGLKLQPFEEPQGKSQKSPEAPTAVASPIAILSLVLSPPPAGGPRVPPAAFGKPLKKSGPMSCPQARAPCSEKAPRSRLTATEPDESNLRVPTADLAGTYRWSAMQT